MTMMTKEAFISAFIAAAPVGRAGWKARAEERAAAAWRVYCAQAQEAAYAAAAAAAREKLAAQRREAAWFVLHEWGCHSFAGELYGAKALYGGPGGSKPPAGAILTTWEEATARAEAISSSAACREARAFWQECLNG
jgi:hypothetical protein